MYSSDNNSNSIRNVLFDAAVQLSVPTVTSTASAATKMRAYSTTEESILSSRSRSPSIKSRYSLTSPSTYFSRHSDLLKPKILRDVATQSSSVLIVDEKIQHRPNHLNLILDNNNNPTRTSSISETSKEYLSVPQPNQYQTSPSSSPTRHGKSLKNALLGIWQGLNSDELRSTASSPIDPKSFEERVRIVISIFCLFYIFNEFFRVLQVGKLFPKLLLLYLHLHEQKKDDMNGFNWSVMQVKQYSLS
jgi:hypothetical protein